MLETIAATPALQGQVDLSHWGTIQVSGADRADFLHRQTTQDFAKLSADQVRLAGICSAKGRLQASFIAWHSDESSIALACSRDLLGATLKRLTMFVLRSQCKLIDVSESRPLLGLVGETAAKALVDLGLSADLQPWHSARIDAASVVRLPDAAGLSRWLWLADSPATLRPDLPAITAAAWDWLDLSSGCARIVAATVEQFVPQMVNFEIVGGVDFGKGCYPGQEVVARSQYRGTLKRRGYLFECDAEAAPAQEIFDSEDPDQPAGMVVNAASGIAGLPGRVLAEVKIAALASGTLHLGSVAGPLLRQLALPYPVPVAQNA
jgi:folate-binding protein YgfZ